MLEQISQIANIILVIAILFTLWYVNKNYKKIIKIYLDIKQTEYNKNKKVQVEKTVISKHRFNNQLSNKVKNRHE